MNPYAHHVATNRRISKCEIIFDGCGRKGTKFLVLASL
jgi:hypothetical protein